MKLIWFSIGFFLSTYLGAQNSNYWQQGVKYDISVEMDTKTNQYQGMQSIEYTNNSPDTLHKAYFHLYFNAFQPGSMMDVRSRNIADPDRRVADRISKLNSSEIGFLHVDKLTIDGKKPISVMEEETILKVVPANPILPGQTVVFKMNFNGQVPLQIRRSGRDGSEGIRYSMSQWYPKLAEYDKKGWHANPYIGREFYGVWGDFNVKITIDASYTVGGSGYIQNPNEVGHGYEDSGVNVKIPKKGPITWHFFAPHVHDFMWAADPDYKHVVKQVTNGPTLHFLYQPGKETEHWEKLPEITAKAFSFMNDTFGKYPYDQFSVVQGGDGGMEYPMSTLITGHRGEKSLVGVTVHEAFHSWYQGVLGTNESLYPWMDEGFTSWASSITMDYLYPSGSSNVHRGSYSGYFRTIERGLDEPMTIHSDHYLTNSGYSSNAYSKGAVFLAQLGYIIGDKALMTGMRRYFNEWKFKHPTPDDFLRVMEKVSDMELDWYLEHFINSTNSIDYAIENVVEKNGVSSITLSRKGNMPMPVDLMIETVDGAKTLINIPLVLMRNEKPQEDMSMKYIVAADWPWTNPIYELTLEIPLSQIKRIEIDPTFRLADIDRSNNTK